MVDQLAHDYGAQPVVFLEQHVDQTVGNRYGRWWAAYGAGGSVYLPLVMADSGHQISNGSVSFYNVYKGMVDAELARASQANIVASCWRVGNRVRVSGQMTNLSGVTLSSSLNGATIHAIVYEDAHVGVTDRYVRAAPWTAIVSALTSGSAMTFTLETTDLTGVNWEKLHTIVLADYRPGGSSGAYDMLQAARATWVTDHYGQDEIIGTWGSGIWYYNVANSTWTEMYSYVPSGPIAAGDVTGDGKADLISCWASGLWYQNGATLGWTNVYSTAPSKVAASDITGDGRAEIIGTWNDGIWYWNPATSLWTKMYSYVPSGPIAAGDVTGDGRADVISCWASGIWYQDGATLGWTRVSSVAPSKVAVGDITGDGRAEIIGTWNDGIWYWNPATSLWTKMYSYVPTGPIAAGDVTGDGRADVVSVWPSGLWYQDGATLGWTKVWSTAPSKIAVGNITGN